MKMIFYKGRLYGFMAVLGLLFGACSSVQPGTESYTHAWEEVVDSERWETALNEPPRAPAENPTYFAVPEYDPRETTEASPDFVQRYPVLVSRAYFRLISEAMEADKEVARSYQELYRESRSIEEQNNIRLQKEFETSQKRFLAHREMLNGLRSWNAFNRYGSDDLDFFLKEEFEPVYEKYNRGVKEDDLVDYLMRRLADLYHQKYGGLTPEEFFEG